VAIWFADSHLQGRAGRNEADGVARDRVVDLGGLTFGQRERCVGRADQDVDLVDVQCMAVLAEPESPWVGIRYLDDEHAFGIGPGAAQLTDRAAGMQRQGAPAVGIGRCSDRRHHPRRLPLEQRAEAPEVRGREPDVGARIPQRPLQRTEETREIVNALAREQFGENREQRAVDPQIRPVLPLAQRAQERGRLAGTQRNPQGVGGLEQGGGLLGGELLRHGVTLSSPATRARWVALSATAGAQIA
jgi:hypothetical protein